MDNFVHIMVIEIQLLDILWRVNPVIYATGESSSMILHILR